MTFVHLACSGAGVSKGFSGEYWGISKGDAKFPLESQLTQMQKLVGRREIDAMVVSIGANDMDFANILEFCVWHSDCPNTVYTVSTLSVVNENNFVMILPSVYAKLMGDLPATLDRSRVYFTEYPDSLGDENGTICRNIINRGGIRAMTGDESQWVYDHFLTPLNLRINNLPRTYGVRVVDNIAGPFSTRGYCSSKSWIVGYDESKSNQGNTNGTMHPNNAGHEHIAKQIFFNLKLDLYKNGGPGKGTIRPPK